MRADESRVPVCPDDETLAALIERRLAETEVARLERHVAVCPSCLDVVAAALAPNASEESTPVLRPVAGAARAEGRWRWRRFALAASVLLVAAAGVGGAALTGAFGSRAAPRLIQITTSLLGVPLRADRIGVRLGAGPASVVLSARQVVIGNIDAVWARAEEIGVTLAFAAPFSGEPVMQHVRVTRPDVDLLGRDPTVLLGSRTVRERVLASLRTDGIEVVEGRVLLRGPNGSVLAVEGITGGAERDGETVRVAFVGRTAGGSIDLSGHAALDADALAITIGGRGLDAEMLPLLGERLRGRVDLRLDFGTRNEALRVEGRMVALDGRLLGSGPRVAMPLGPDTLASLGAFDPALAKDDLPFDEARAAFAWRHGAWRIPRIFVSRRGILVGGRVRIDPDDHLSGYGTVRLPAEVVAALEPHAPPLGRFRDASGVATLPFGLEGTLATPAVTLGRP